MSSASAPKIRMPANKSGSELFISPGFLIRLLLILVNLFGKKKYIPESRQCADEKENNDKKRSSQFFIDKTSQKRTAKFNNQNENNSQNNNENTSQNNNSSDGNPVTIPLLVRLPALPNNLAIAIRLIKFTMIIKTFKIAKTVVLPTGIPASDGNDMNFVVKIVTG